MSPARPGRVVCSGKGHDGREIVPPVRPIPSESIPMRQANVSVYGSRTCPDTTRRGIPFEFKDVDQNPAFNDYIAGLNHGKRVMPTIQVENEFLINPDLDKLGESIQAAAEA